MPLTDYQRLTQLRNILAKLYPERESIERIAYDAGISRQSLPNDPAMSSINFWHSVLAEAEKLNRVGQLLESAHGEYSDNQELQAAISSSGLDSVIDNVLHKQQSAVFSETTGSSAKYWVLLLLMVVTFVCGYWYWSQNPDLLIDNTPKLVPVAPFPTGIVPSQNPTANITTNLSLIEITETPALPSIETLSGTLYIQGEAITEGLYLVNGTEASNIDIGSDLIVYAEIIPGTEIAIAVVEVVGRNPDSLTVQPILISPERKIRAALRVDTNIDNLTTSELIPAAEYAIGYVLTDGKIAMRPNVEIVGGQLVQALQIEKIDSTIVDALPFDPPIIMQITVIGRTGNVASVDLIQGEWPVSGTLVEMYSK